MSSSSLGTRRFGAGFSSSCHGRLLHAGSPVTGTGLHREPFAPASMPPILLIHQNPSPNTVSSRQRSFSPCLMGQEGSHYPLVSVQLLTTFSIPPSDQPFQGKQGCCGSSGRKGAGSSVLGRPGLNTHSHFIIPLNTPCPFRNGNADVQ